MKTAEAFLRTEKPSDSPDSLRSAPSMVQLPSPFVLDCARRQGLFGLGEKFVAGEWDTTHLNELIYHLVSEKLISQRTFSPQVLSCLIKTKLLDSQGGAKAFEVGRRHYDLGNDLFEAMLDRSMTYTSGYWKNAKNLDDAQYAKLELVCKKLKLAPGMRVLDIGCGWGNFAEHAARNYGVSVVGLTISEEQARYARERCQGLDVEILLQDYRSYRGKFDCVVSIEMIEAVGKKNIPLFYNVVEECLKSHGQFLVQVISGESFSRYSTAALDQYVTWLLKYIFPNGYLPNMKELNAPARKQFVLEEVENMVGDYEKTLHAWEQNFERNWPTLKARYGEEFRRIWRYYLGGCAAMFRLRLVQVYQFVYTKRS